MRMNRWRYVGLLLASVVAISIVIYLLWGFNALVSALMIEAPAIELLGVIIAAVPEIPYLRGYTSAVRTVNQIDNAVNQLADHSTEIDESVSGYHYVAEELVDQTGIEYPTTIRSTRIVTVPQHSPSLSVLFSSIRGRSTRIATAYRVDNQDVVDFDVSSLVREARRHEQRSAEWFQSLGLTVIAVGFAVQLLASILVILL